MTLVSGGTSEPAVGVEVFTTFSTTTELVTVDEQCVVHGPVVIVAEFTTVVASVLFTTASKATFAESPRARESVSTSVVPVTLTVQESPVATVLQVGVPDSVTLDGSASLTVAVPDAVPTFFTSSVYPIVDPGTTGLPAPGVSDFVTVKLGKVGVPGVDGGGGGVTGLLTVFVLHDDVRQPGPE